jgi:predicted ATPase
MAILKQIDIHGYKSIENASIMLGRLNVLIGANGSGKSNLLSFFKLVHEMRQGRLQVFVGKEGGADTLLFYGSKTTKQLEAYLSFENDGNDVSYRLCLTPTATDSLIFEEEKIKSLELNKEIVIFQAPRNEMGFPINTINEFGKRTAHQESQLAPMIDIWRSHGEESAIHAGEIVFHALDNWSNFWFCDTSAIRRQCYMHDNKALHSDGENLAAILYKIQQTQKTAFHRIVATVQQIAPWFGEFVLEPLELNKNNVQLNWRDRYSDHIFGPHQLPDGGLRAIALVTLLLQPEEDLPSLIVIDEPELGLHPNAITVIASLLMQASFHSQVIIATQLPTLLDEFDPENIIVVDRENGKTTFSRPNIEHLNEWLKDYSLGEVWQKNVIGGGPMR